jgi:hypothetical protein
VRWHQQAAGDHPQTQDGTDYYPELPHRDF